MIKQLCEHIKNKSSSEKLRGSGYYLLLSKSHRLYKIVAVGAQSQDPIAAEDSGMSGGSAAENSRGSGGSARGAAGIRGNSGRWDSGAAAGEASGSAGDSGGGTVAGEATG